MCGSGFPDHSYEPGPDRICACVACRTLQLKIDKIIDKVERQKHLDDIAILNQQK